MPTLSPAQQDNLWASLQSGTGSWAIMVSNLPETAPVLERVRRGMFESGSDAERFTLLEGLRSQAARLPREWLSAFVAEYLARARPLWDGVWDMGLNHLADEPDFQAVMRRVLETRGQCFQSPRAVNGLLYALKHRPGAIVALAPDLIASAPGLPENEAGDVLDLLATVRLRGAAADALSELVRHYLALESDHFLRRSALRCLSSIGPGRAVALAPVVEAMAARSGTDDAGAATEALIALAVTVPARSDDTVRRFILPWLGSPLGGNGLRGIARLAPGLSSDLAREIGDLLSQDTRWADPQINGLAPFYQSAAFRERVFRAALIDVRLALTAMAHLDEGQARELALDWSGGVRIGQGRLVVHEAMARRDLAWTAQELAHWLSHADPEMRLLGIQAAAARETASAIAPPAVPLR